VGQFVAQSTPTTPSVKWRTSIQHHQLHEKAAHFAISRLARGHRTTRQSQSDRFPRAEGGRLLLRSTSCTFARSADDPDFPLSTRARPKPEAATILIRDGCRPHHGRRTCRASSVCSFCPMAVFGVCKAHPEVSACYVSYCAPRLSINYDAFCTRDLGYRKHRNTGPRRVWSETIRTETPLDEL
jgi:hypothetical protein